MYIYTRADAAIRRKSCSKMNDHVRAGWCDRWSVAPWCCCPREGRRYRRDGSGISARGLRGSAFEIRPLPEKARILARFSCTGARTGFRKGNILAFNMHERGYGYALCMRVRNSARFTSVRRVQLLSHRSEKKKSHEITRLRLQRKFGTAPFCLTFVRLQNKRVQHRG